MLSLTFLVFLPLLIFLSLLLFSNILAQNVVKILTLFFIFVLNIYNGILLLFLIITRQVFLEQVIWLQSHNIVLELTTVGDFLSLSMTLLVITITSCIIIYSLEYIKEDPAFIRFIGYLFLFLFSMLFMVNAGNYIQFFIGWEYVGLTSYLLINFWYTRNEANKGGLKAIIYNRVGDVSFLCALSYIYIFFGTFKFSIIFPMLSNYINTYNSNTNFIKITDLEIIAFLLLIAAAAKSAQLFLHSWLVDAMEGPTPVSALLHSATMVTAGIFLILRSSEIFVYSPNVSTILIFLGTLTMLVSSLIALTQNDIKRIVAFSTCSQLGLMMISAGFGCYLATYFHLITHAFFKSALFLSCGMLIHSLSDEQDIRKMGKLIIYFPTIYIGSILCSLALMGFPMLSGFFSKDFILESLVTTYIKFSSTMFLLGVLGALLTAAYSLRFIYLIFFSYDKPRLTIKTIPVDTAITIRETSNAMLEEEEFNKILLLYKKVNKINNINSIEYILNILKIFKINHKNYIMLHNQQYQKYQNWYVEVMYKNGNKETLNKWQIFEKSKKLNNEKKKTFFLNLDTVVAPKMGYPFLLLSFLAIISGFFLEKMFFSSTALWNNSLSLTPITEILDNEHEITNIIKILPLFATIFGMLFIYFYLNTTKLAKLNYKLRLYYYISYTLLTKKFFFDFIYNSILTKRLLIVSYQIFYNLIDKGFLEYFGPSGIYNLIGQIKKSAENLHNSYILTYILLLVYYCVIIIIFSLYFYLKF